jgi:thiol peroxidase
MKYFTYLAFTLFVVSHQLSAHEQALSKQLQTSDLVKAGDKFITLLGKQVKVGDKAPNFKVVDENFSPVELTHFSNKNILISVVPSLDTGVCSLQTKRFNDEIVKLPDELISLTISNDLPFAQKRFCATEKIDRIKVLSDSVWRDFGENYGLLIKDMGLLSRAILVINNKGILVYKELVADISNHPDYNAALAAVNGLSDVPNTVLPSVEKLEQPSIEQLEPPSVIPSEQP